MAITKLNQGTMSGPNSSVFHPYHYTVLDSEVLERPELGHQPGTRAQAWNEDCNSIVEVIWGKSSEAIFAGALCTFAEDYSAKLSDSGDRGAVAVCVGNGVQQTPVAADTWCWFIVYGQARVHSADLSAGTALYLDGANPGGVDDLAVTGELVSNAFAMEADVVTSNVYNQFTAKIMLSYPKVDSVSPTPT